MATRRRAQGPWTSDWLWMPAILLIAVVPRAAHLGQQSLRIDEGTTFMRLTLPLSLVLESLFVVRDQVPLYYAAARLWSLAAGTSEFALRFPSLFFSVLNLAALYRLGRTSGHLWVGRLATLLGAVNPFDIYYSCEARMYPMAGAFITVNMTCFVLILMARADRRPWIGFTISAGLMYLTHYFSFFLAVIQLLYFLIRFRGVYRLFRRWLLAQIVACIPAAVWTAAGYHQYRTLGLQGAWIPRPTLLTPLYTFWNFSLGYDGRLTLGVVLGLFTWAIALVAGIAWQRVVASKWRLLMIVWLILPAMTTLALSFVRRPAYVDRYVSISMSAFLLLAATGIATLPRLWLRVGLTVLLLVATLHATAGMLRGERLVKADWRSAIQHILHNAQPGDRIVIQETSLFVTHYYVRNELPIELLDGRGMTASLTAALLKGGRAWFLYRDPLRTNHKLDEAVLFDPYETGDPQIATWLHSRQTSLAGEWYWPGLYLVLLDPSP